MPHSAQVVQADSATDNDHDDALALAPSVSHGAAHSSHEDHGDSHPECHKFCKDEGATVPKHASADSPNFSHQLIDTGIAIPAHPTSAALVRRVAERPWANGPPLVIRFLRLTL